MASAELRHAIKKESNSKRVFTALVNYGSIPGFVKNSGTPQEWHLQCVCVFGEDCVVGENLML